MCLWAVIRSCFSARLFGVGFGFFLRKSPSLSFAGFDGLVQQSFQFCYSLFKNSDLGLQPSTVRTTMVRRVIAHTANIGKIAA